MAPSLSGQASIFGVVFFVSKSRLGIEGQKKLAGKICNFDLKASEPCLNPLCLNIDISNVTYSIEINRLIALIRKNRVIWNNQFVLWLDKASILNLTCVLDNESNTLLPFKNFMQRYNAKSNFFSSI